MEVAASKDSHNSPDGVIKEEALELADQARPGTSGNFNNRRNINNN
jgi:hypothetical protein